MRGIYAARRESQSCRTARSSFGNVKKTQELTCWREHGDGIARGCDVEDVASRVVFNAFRITYPQCLDVEAGHDVVAAGRGYAVEFAIGTRVDGVDSFSRPVCDVQDPPICIIRDPFRVRAAII